MKLFAKKALRQWRALQAAGLVLALAVAFAPMVLANGGGKKKASPTPGGSPSANGSPNASPTPKFNVPIPPGHMAEGVKLPYFDIRGKLQMYFNIQKALRLDDIHLELKNAYLVTYDDKQDQDVTVFMTHAILDLNTRIVTSEVPVTVRRSDFQILGQKMEFNTQTKQGRMTGHVTTTIYNRQALASPTPSPSPGAAKPDSSPSAASPSATATP